MSNREELIEHLETTLLSWLKRGIPTRVRMKRRDKYGKEHWTHRTRYDPATVDEIRMIYAFLGGELRIKKKFAAVIPPEVQEAVAALEAENPEPQSIKDQIAENGMRRFGFDKNPSGNGTTHAS